MIANASELVHHAKRIHGQPLPPQPLNNAQAYIELLAAAWRVAHPELPADEAVIVIREGINPHTHLPETRVFMERKSYLSAKYPPPNFG